MDTVKMNWANPEGVVATRCLGAMANAGGTEDLTAMMAEISLDYLDEYEHKPLPAEPMILGRFKRDQEEADWRKKSRAEKDSVVKRLHLRDDVKKYFEEYNTALTECFGQVHNIEKWMDACIEWKEMDKAKMWWGIYAQYPQELKLLGGRAIWKKRLGGDMRALIDQMKEVFDGMVDGGEEEGKEKEVGEN